METLVVTPHVGIGPVCLGMSQGDARAAMAAIGLALESSNETSDYFCDSLLQVEYEPDGTASFIGVSSSAKLRVQIYDVDVFDTRAEKMFGILAAADGSGRHQYDEGGYVFPRQIVTLFEADRQYDVIGGGERPIWAQIGIGDQRYYEAIQRLKRPE